MCGVFRLLSFVVDILTFDNCRNCRPIRVNIEEQEPDYKYYTDLYLL